MRDADLRTSLDTIDGDAPSPEFLTALFVRLEREVGAADLHDELPSYSSTPPDEADRFEPSTAREPGRRHTLVVTAAAVVLVVLVGLIVLQPGGGGNQVATTRLPHGYVASVLPDAVVQRSDGNVVVPTAPATGIDSIVPAWYEEERTTLDDLGVVGLSVPFDLEVPAATVDCRGLRRSIDIAGVVRHLPCGGTSGALLFADDAAAVDALDLLVGHLEGNSTGIYQLGVVLERVAELDARLGDEAEAFVLEQFIDSRIAADVVVIAWRSDNLVQYVWDIQDRGTAGGVDALMAVAQRIERRTAAQQQPGAGS